MANISNSRPLRNTSEWRGRRSRVFTSLAADVDFYTQGPQSPTSVPAAEVHLLASVAGNLVLTGTDGVDVTLPCTTGWNVFPCEWRKMKTAGTTVTGTMVVYW